MAIAHVQSALNGDLSGSSVSLSFSSTVGNGDLVCGFVVWFASGGATLSSVTDNQGNSYTIVDTLVDATSAVGVASFYCADIVNAPRTITATLNASVVAGIGIDEYSGIAASNALNVHSSNLQTQIAAGSNALTSGAATTTTNGCLIYGASTETSGSTTVGFSAGTGFTQRNNQEFVINSEFGVFTEDQIQSTAGAIAATATPNASGDDFATFLMAFAPAITAAAVVPKYQKLKTHLRR